MWAYLIAVQIWPKKGMMRKSGCGLDQNLAERRREFRQFVKFSGTRSLATF